MARKPRIHFPGAFYHVILRGNAGDPIFFDDRDRYRLYLILQAAVEKFHCRIHAFCLMRNHVHLLVQVDEIPLSRIMQNISLRFTKWINFKQSRTGHLFQGRYKALLVDADAYLLELVRYIHLNPVRAGAVAASEDYPWTGHHGYLGKECLPWLSTDLVLPLFSEDVGKARRAYRKFVLDGVGEGRREEFHDGNCEGRILGNEAFADAILANANQPRASGGSLEEIVGAVCAYFQISMERLKAPGKQRPMSEARAISAAIVQSSSHLRMTDLGKMLDRDVSALGKAAQRAVATERLAPVLRKVLGMCGNKISESQT